MSGTLSDTAPEASLPRSSRLPLATQHRCFLILPVEGLKFPAEPDCTLGRFAKAQQEAELGTGAKGGRCVADSLLETITDKRANWPVWERSHMAPGHDLYPHIRRLLGEKGDAEAIKRGDLHASIFRLTEGARKLATGERLAYPKETDDGQPFPKDERRPLQLSLLLGASALTRIRRRVDAFESDALSIDLVNLDLVVFRTKYAFLVAEISFSDGAASEIDPYLIVEGLVALARVNKMTWRRWDRTPIDDAPVFGFTRLIRSFLPVSDPGQRAERVHTATFLQFEKAVANDSLNHLTVQLCRHYTDDYRIVDEVPGIESVRHFDNVSHAFSMEGAITIVNLANYSDGGPPNFLQNFLNSTYRNHYLPIILLGYHEFCFLLNATNDASFWPTESNEKTDIHKMEKIRNEIMNFTLCFRFSYVSRITMHNAVNHALRKSLGLDWILHELDRDTAQIDAFLRKASEERKEKSFRWASVIGVSGITWLTSFTIFKELLKVAHFEYDDAGGIATALGIAIAVFTGVITAVKDGQRHHHGPAEHAVQENVIHQAKS